MQESLFPTMCVDNFYEDPYKVREWALSLDFNDEENEDGKWPGIRTPMIHEIDHIFFDTFCRKLLSMYFDLSKCNMNWNVVTNFQLIDPYDDPELNKGWVHYDDRSIFGGIIYLDTDPDLNAGTTVGDVDFSQIDEEEFNKLQDIRKEFYQGKLTTDAELNEYKRLLNLNNELYVPTAEFKNKFNRLVSFDGTCPHQANFGSPGKKRLTQVFFVNDLNTNSSPPLLRSKDYKQMGM
jgi:hypothetical protein